MTFVPSASVCDCSLVNHLPPSQGSNAAPVTVIVFSALKAANLVLLLFSAHVLDFLGMVMLKSRSIIASQNTSLLDKVARSSAWNVAPCSVTRIGMRVKLLMTMIV